MNVLELINRAAGPICKSQIPLHVKILVFDLATGEQIREHNVNWSKMMRDNDDKLKWLLKLVVWATKNGKSVEIISCGDHNYDKETVPTS